MNDLNNIIYFYKITNTVDDEVYIGSSKVPRERWYKHRSACKSTKTRKCVIQHKMIELGVDNFSFHIIESGVYDTKQKALEREDELMLEYKAINYQCASKTQRIANETKYNKEYNNRPEVKQRKAEWAKKKHAETYAKGCPMQKAKTKAYYDANKGKKQQYHYNRWELKTFMTRKHFSFGLYN
eukprot:SAG11_NODE_6600_length_1280_cov_17.044030_2_plen_183_part_00